RRLLDNFLPLRRIVRIFCPHFFELCQGRHVAVFAAQHADVGVRLGLEGAASRAEQRGGEQQRAQQWTCVSDRIQAGTTCSTVWASHWSRSSILSCAISMMLQIVTGSRLPRM